MSLSMNTRGSGEPRVGGVAQTVLALAFDTSALPGTVLRDPQIHHRTHQPTPSMDRVPGYGATAGELLGSDAPL